MRLVYRGPEAGDGMAAEILRREGLKVWYEPPMETRSGGSDLILVTFYIADKVLDATVGVSVESAVKAAVAKIKARLPEADIKIEEDI